jgi:hypothetical protein
MACDLDRLAASVLQKRIKLASELQNRGRDHRGRPVFDRLHGMSSAARCGARSFHDGAGDMSPVLAHCDFFTFELFACYSRKAVALSRYNSHMILSAPFVNFTTSHDQRKRRP